MGTSITRLPNEILTEVLSFVPAVDLLKTCRLVSRLWCKIATTFCRNRQVEIQIPDTAHINIFSTFRDINNLPWAAMSLSFSSNSTVFPYLSRIIETYGSNLKQLSIDLPDYSFLKFALLLKFMPNLEKLSVTIIHDSSAYIPLFLIPIYPEVIEYPDASLIKLPEFFDLKINIETPINVVIIYFLEFLYKITYLTSPILELNINNKVPDAEFGIIVKAILQWNAISLSLSLPYSGPNEGWYLLATNPDLEVVNLTITSSARIIQDDDYFYLLEVFIENCAKSCWYLQLIGFCSDESSGPILVSRQITIPKLPEVEILVIEFSEGSHSPPTFDPPLGFSFLHIRHPFYPIAFPKLEKIYLESETGYNCTRNLDIRNVFKLSYLEDSFERVNSLRVNYYNGFGDGRWTEIFPCVKILKVTIQDAQHLKEIFSHLGKLEKLTVRIDPEHFDVWRLLRKSFRPIPNLKGLKELHLKVIGTDGSKRGVLLLAQVEAAWLIWLKPLRLRISNVKISKDFESLLRKWHTNLELR